MTRAVFAFPRTRTHVFLCYIGRENSSFFTDTQDNTGAGQHLPHCKRSEDWQLKRKKILSPGIFFFHGIWTLPIINTAASTYTE